MFKPFQLSGIGLHSGQKTTVKVLPAQKGEGRYFVRVDLPEKPIIPAHINSLTNTTLSTELANGQAKVRTVEHLLAALSGCGIEDARLEIDGAEVPLLDGSAKLWVEKINPPLTPFDNPKVMTKEIDEPIWVRDGDAFVAALPSSELCFSYGVDYPYAAIGNQWYSWYPARESFAVAIAPARTFGFADQVEELKSMGLIKGGSLDNALVCDANGWLNPPLRFDNEPVRHKILDLIGDLSLLGVFPLAHFLAYKASHNLHSNLVKQLIKIYPPH
jgi:UDP-3-O-[3-hydroxymyristoyl] N-acetylglucosamine deacetylase